MFGGGWGIRKKAPCLRLGAAASPVRVTSKGRWTKCEAKTSESWGARLEVRYTIEGPLKRVEPLDIWGESYLVHSFKLSSLAF